MVKESFIRQKDLFNPIEVGGKVQIIGVGSVGSFVALSLAKMGITDLEVWDDDRVEAHNLPNQFYRLNDIRYSKVVALYDIVQDFCGSSIKFNDRRYNGEELDGLVISAVDSMGTRSLIWDNIKDSKKVAHYIDTRMGGNLMRIYSIDLKDKKSVKHYEKSLNVEDTLSKLKCTERTIIYNVLTISGIVGSLVAKIFKKEVIPEEIIFDMKNYQFLINE